MLPTDLKMRAERAALERGVSFAELLRSSLELFLARTGAKDSLFADSEVFDRATPPDLSQAHDEYLYGTDE